MKFPRSMEDQTIRRHTAPTLYAVYNQNPIYRWMKGCILHFPKKGGLGLAKNYWGITLTSKAAKIYNSLLCNCIEPKIDKILWKNQNSFRRNRSTTSQLLTIHRILEGVWAKKIYRLQDDDDDDDTYKFQYIALCRGRKNTSIPSRRKH